jgi:hypothetical protein
LGKKRAFCAGVVLCSSSQFFLAPKLRTLLMNFNGIDGNGSPVVRLVYSGSWNEFIPDELKISSSIILSFDLSCSSSFFHGSHGDFHVAHCHFS